MFFIKEINKQNCIYKIINNLNYIKIKMSFKNEKKYWNKIPNK